MRGVIELITCSRCKMGRKGHFFLSLLAFLWLGLRGVCKLVIVVMPAARKRQS